MTAPAPVAHDPAGDTRSLSAAVLRAIRVAWLDAEQPARDQYARAVLDADNARDNAVRAAAVACAARTGREGVPFAADEAAARQLAAAAAEAVMGRQSRGLPPDLAAWRDARQGLAALAAKYPAAHAG